MSFYLAHPAGENTKKTISPAVKDKGLSFLRAKPSSVLVTVIPETTQAGYADYVKNLPAFMYATHKKEVVPLENRGYLIGKIDQYLPWRLPDFIYEFKKDPNDAKEEDLKQHSVRIGGKNSKKKTFVMRNPTLDKYIAFVNENAGIDSKTSHTIGTVNSDAMQVVLLMLKIFSMFCTTHTYPAVRHCEDMYDVVELDDSMKSPVAKRAKVSEDPSLGDGRSPTKKEHVKALMKRTKERADSNPENIGMYVKLNDAKPTLQLNQPWGNARDMPNASGLFVPYVRELSTGDEKTVPDVIESLFLRCLSSTVPGMYRKMKTIRAAWGVIQTTGLGHEMSHLARCIEIAIKAQSIVYPVYADSIYEGTIICGAGFSVFCNDECIKPLAYAELQKLVISSSAHSQALEKLCDIVVSTEKRGLLRNAKSVRAISRIMMDVELDNFNRSEVVTHVHQLSFDNKYWSTSLHNVRQMLELLKDETLIIPSSVPMNPDYLFSDDRVECVLSAFGHSAPTFMIPNAPAIKLSREDPPNNFRVRTVAVSAAIQDMKYMMENGYMTNNVQRLSSKHTDKTINGGEKTTIWSYLKTCYNNAKDDSDSETKPSGGTDRQEEDDVLDQF